MNRLAFLGGVTGLCAVALLFVSQRGHAADRGEPGLSPAVPELRGPSLELRAPAARGAGSLVASPMADINDVYTWMDGNRLVLAMTVSPSDDASREFGPGVQYVFHLHSKSGIGVLVNGTGEETRVVCTFQSNAVAQCWVTDATGGVKDYVTGDPSSTAGIASTSGNVRMFAGRRSDPFFFNLQGFRAALSALRALPITRDAAGCPNNLTNQQMIGVAAQLRAEIPVAEAPCPANQLDCFLQLNVRAIVVQVDKSLVNASSNATVGVWASTHTGS